MKKCTERNERRINFQNGGKSDLPVNREIAPIKNHKENCKTGYDFTIMGKRLIYAKITCVAGLSLFSFTLNTAVKASGLLYSLRTKFRYLSATVRRQSALGSMAMFTSSLGLPRLIKTLLCMFCLGFCCRFVIKHRQGRF